MNRLTNENSPYLLQHSSNPVDWYPWGKEAFQRAREEEKPVLLSVGYSSCHWCHVMAHESFENDQIASLMNEGFINIKVDREERPDIDSVYMTATQAMTGHGGWPMTVFMTSDQKPFYAGTYFPPTDTAGRPGFPRLLLAIRDAWANDREKLLESADSLTERLLTTEGHLHNTEEINPEVTSKATEQLKTTFDANWGGFGSAPKFPSPTTLEFLLMYNSLSGREKPANSALEMTLTTLRSMAKGGIYDQLGGGFARYSVDERWLVPHFEKMLYDNAQLVRCYLHAFQITNDRFFERIARNTLAYLEREMLNSDGGFYSAQDADSDGIEGSYFLWTTEQVREVLGDEDSSLFNDYYGVTVEGNFTDPHEQHLTGRNVLSVPQDPESVAQEYGIEVVELETRLDYMRSRMLEARSQRVPPGLDDKVLTSWNGLAMAAFAEASRVLGDDHYREIAERNASFVRDHLRTEKRLLHSYLNGTAKVDGMLEDYAYYGLGLIELFRASGDLDLLHWAVDLLEEIIARFQDPKQEGFYETASDGEKLLLRQQPFFDGPTPSGNGAAALLAIWLARYLDREDWEKLARHSIEKVVGKLIDVPGGLGSIGQAVELLLSPRREVAIVGEPRMRVDMERELGKHFLPSTAIVPSANGQELPVLEGRESDDSVKAYVCTNMTCLMPAATSEELVAQLNM